MHVVPAQFGRGEKSPNDSLLKKCTILITVKEIWRGEQDRVQNRDLETVRASCQALTQKTFLKAREHVRVESEDKLFRNYEIKLQEGKGQR